MTDLSRVLLSAARDGLTPDAATMARVRAKVAAAAGIAPNGVASPPPSPVATLPALPARRVVRVAIAVAIAVAVVASVTLVSVVSTRSDVAREPIEIAVRHGDREVIVPRTTLTSPAADPAVPALGSIGIATTVAPPAPARMPARMIEPPTLAREVELVDRAMVHLRRGDPDAALADLAIYRRETRGHGQLAEDAAAVDIEARCVLRRDVTGILAAFDRAWPTSAQRARLAAACRTP